MAVRFVHDQKDNSIYFITFTCFKWKCLFQLADSYDAVYKWFNSLYEKSILVNAYVIMPNHVHALIYFPQMPKSLNTLVGNGKRFMAYDIINKLEEKKEIRMLEELYSYVKTSERKKGQRHKVFEDSFEAKECYSRKFIMQKLNYINYNPVSKKWQLVEDFRNYIHSSAGFYENGIIRYDKLVHVAEVW